MDETKLEKYKALCHAMQTGVAFKMEYDPSDTQPKHLRVGINAAMCDHAALVNLLRSKGIITDDEYFDALIESMQTEVDNYRREISDQTGANITLA
jgi:uncharacterized lipoprotein YbaY